MRKYTEIGKRLRHLRAHHSQKEFAERIGITCMAYQNYEYGKRIPKGDILLRIAGLCDVPVDWILSGVKKEMKEIKPDFEDFPDYFSYFKLTQKVKRICKEGDTTKLKVLKDLLKTLDPGTNEALKEEELERKLKEGAV